MLPAPFQGTGEYRETFTRGLIDLLKYDQLGTFILVLTNATYDARIHHVLESRLESRYHELSSLLRVYLTEGRPLDHTSDDLMVFLKLMAVGFEHVPMSAFRHAGKWQVQYNQLRSFRPARMSNLVITDLHKPFDEQGFHFNKPFLQREIMWQGDLLGRDCSLFYNKFPFAPLHGLLVVERQQNRPQFLEQETHHYLWQVLELLGSRMPGVGFGYNSTGAFSSVNHQHVQMYLQDMKYPIEQPNWQHNGGTEAYPLATRCVRDATEAWTVLHELHQANQAYNLLYRPGIVYITPRAMQGSFNPYEGTCGFAWAEVAGAVTTVRGDDFYKLQEQQITDEMSKLAI